MKRGIPTAALAAFALTLSAALATQARADCDSDDRVGDTASYCLAEWHSDPSYRITNWCLHRIKAHIDIASGADKTMQLSKATQHVELGITFTNPTIAEGTLSLNWPQKIRHIKCCSDYSSCN